jgi:hypothetical protein
MCIVSPLRQKSAASANVGRYRNHFHCPVLQRLIFSAPLLTVSSRRIFLEARIEIETDRNLLTTDNQAACAFSNSMIAPGGSMLPIKIAF